MKYKNILFLYITLFYFSSIQANPVEQWRVQEISFTSTVKYSNPFMDCEMTATFTGPGNVTITRPAFWDGGNTWKVRFAPTITGNWTYSTSCSDPSNTGLHNLTGSGLCVPYTGNLDIYKHGFISKSANGRYLQYADGYPFFYLGDTHWFMEYEDFSKQFTAIIHKRKEQNYTVIQSHPTTSTLSNSGATAIDPLKYQDLDRYFKRIANTGMVHSFGLAAHSAIDYLTPEGAARIAKYTCARYGAYPVIFFTSQEVDLYNNQDRWKYAFDSWIANDDYNHLATAHVWGSVKGEPLIWANDPEHDLFFLQGGHGQVQSINHYKTYWSYNTPTKPLLEVEANYEEIVMGPNPNDDSMVRIAAYKSIQCGSAGFGYGANGLWNNCYSSTNCSCCEKWGINYWEDALNFPGGSQMKHLYDFYASLKWWKMTPRFNDPSWSDFDEPEKSVLSSDNRNTFIIYFYGSNNLTGVLKNMTENVVYKVRWFNQRTGEYTLISQSVVPVSGTWTIPNRYDTKDWVLVVTDDGQ